MSAFMKPNQGAIGILLAIFLGSSVWWWVDHGLPDDRLPREAIWLKARDAAALGIIAAPPGSDLAQPIAAARFCEAHLGVPTQQADCGTGRLLVAAANSNDDARRLALVRVETGLVRFEALRAAVLEVSSGHASSNWMVGLIDQRMERIRQRTQEPAATHTDLFNALLLVEGARYNSLSGQFSLIRWDIARVIDDPDRLASQASRLGVALGVLPWALGLLTVASAGLVWWKVGVSALAGVALVMGSVSLGLLIIADASLRFGEGALGLALNPFTYALPRQVWVVYAAAACFLVCLLAARPLTRALEWFSHRLAVAALIGAVLVPVFYAVVSPAAGSEALKIWVCGLAGLVVVRHARQAYLARETVSGFMRFGSLWRALFSASAAADIHRHLLKAFGLVFALALLVVGVAAVVFQDFGGALISAGVFLALIYIIFGWRFLAVAIGLGSMLSVVAMLTDRVMGRLLLMLEPMQAAVSDFARLIKFAEGGQPSGYGLGTTQWCSHEGACLPLQSLSDYLPTLLMGTLGDTIALALLAGLLTLYVCLLVVAVRGLAFGSRESRALYAIGFFLLIATALQTVVTSLGNLRLIPLTGLGLPLMSLGLSSFLSVSVGLGCLAAASAQSRGQRAP